MVILGLGSNIGDREGYLAAAIRVLAPIIGNIRLSRILESEAVLPENAMPDMNFPYLNMAVRGDSQLPPEELLATIKSLEISLGRVQRRQWGPREIDMDILSMDSLVLESPQLNIPHKELLNRDFALVPLSDVAPEWKYPVPGIYYQKTPIEMMREKGYGLKDTLRATGITLHV